MTEQEKHIAHPDPVVHSDNEKSAIPARPDDKRNGAPNDPPGPKDSEPPVG